MSAADLAAIRAELAELRAFTVLPLFELVPYLVQSLVLERIMQAEDALS